MSTSDLGNGDLELLLAVLVRIFENRSQFLFYGKCELELESKI